VDFHTAVCVLDSASGEHRTATVATTVEFRDLSPAAIASYLAREPALDCAGSFKAEALGIALCRRISGDDPTALIGLPLIELVRLLADFGVDVLASQPSPA
jgi:septum formation protein